MRSFLKSAAIACAGFSIAVSLGAAPLRAEPGPKEANPKIDWEVKNNFRLIDGDKEQAQFLAELEKKVESADEGTPYVEPRKRCNGNNYCSKFNPTTNQYDGNWYANTNRRIALKVIGGGKITACQWSKARDADAASPEWQRIGSKTTATADVIVGKNRIRAECSAGQRKLPPIDQIVDVKDIKIIAIGDSYMAGEGSPQIIRGDPNAPPTTPGATPDDAKQKPAQWLQPRCQNSLLSTTGIAAAHLAGKNKRLSVTYVNVACSGAELNEGILKQYEGRATYKHLQKMYAAFNLDQRGTFYPSAYLPSQIQQVKNVACRNGQCAADYIFVLTGGNELKFADIVRDMITGCTASCRARMLRELRPALDALPETYRKLKTELDGMFTASSEQPSPSVVLLQYPNPVQFTKGSGRSRSVHSCRDTFFKGMVSGVAKFTIDGVSAVNSQFAYREILRPLNKALKSIAGDLQWRHVATIEDLTTGNGYCASERWFNTIDDSAKKQDVVPVEGDPRYDGLPTGTMHPNIIGYYSMAAEVERCFEFDQLIPAEKNAPKEPTCPRVQPKTAAK